MRTEPDQDNFLSSLICLASPPYTCYCVCHLRMNYLGQHGWVLTTSSGNVRALSTMCDVPIWLFHRQRDFVKLCISRVFM